MNATQSIYAQRRARLASMLGATVLGRACTDAVRAAGLQAVGQLFHAFPVTAHSPRG